MLNERDGRLFVQGDMTMNQAAALLAAGEARCKQGEVVVDMSEVASADSAAIAVVLGWIRRAQAAGHRVQVHRPPQSFISLAALYGVEQLLAPYVVLPGAEGEVSID